MELNFLGIRSAFNVSEGNNSVGVLDEKNPPYLREISYCMHVNDKRLYLLNRFWFYNCR